MPYQQDPSRWTGARLWVYRTSGVIMPAAAIIRRYAGGRQADTLQWRTAMRAVPGSPQSESPDVAMLLALVQQHGAVWVTEWVAELERQA